MGFGPAAFMPGMFDMHFGSRIGVPFLILAVAMGSVYFVAFSVLGGWFGNHIRYETDIGS